MTNAILFKALQRKLKFRNPEGILKIAEVQRFRFTPQELQEAEKYLLSILARGQHFTYPGDLFYPEAFYRMLEPPLFLEFTGRPVWQHYQIFSVVGARKIHSLSQRWMSDELALFVQKQTDIAIASGGAHGVDQAAHWLSVKQERPTIVILPCGLGNLFPQDLQQLLPHVLKQGGCFLTEFENAQSVRKNFFFFRNRLISAIARMTLVVQAEKKSGSFLTVHHALQNGKTILTVPAHPLMTEFSGNLHLMKDGCFFAHTNKDLLDFWHADSWPGRVQPLDIDCI